MCRSVLLVFLSSWATLGVCHDGKGRNHDLHQATQEIFNRIRNVQACENRGDTLFFEDVLCGAGRPCGALLLDELYPLRRNPSTVVGVFRVFNVSNQPYVSPDTSRWEAVTYLGEGRGYQVVLSSCRSI